MIEPLQFVDALEKLNIRFVTGVPDSLLKNVCGCINSRLPSDRHIIATNEGSAVGLAIGHYLATGCPAFVYMQNSGLCNVINPVTSLADPKVFGVPMVLMIGWRGEILEEGKQLRDEPQHVKQGEITVSQLEILDIPYRIIDSSTKMIVQILDELIQLAKLRSGPVAIVIRKNTFAPFKIEPLRQDASLPTREEAIRAVLEIIPEDSPVISTTGMASREVFELRKARQQGHHRDFLTVGGLGHASQIAAGIAMAQPQRCVICIDGDGSVLMHTGALAISADCDNLIHILINNEAHDSVGGQPTKGRELNFSEIARQLGYRNVNRVFKIYDLQLRLKEALTYRQSTLIEVKCKRGSRRDLGRPDRTPLQNKNDFMEFLRREK